MTDTTSSDLSLQDDISMNNLADSIIQLVNQAKGSVARHINTAIVITYWNIGKHIVEFEQNGNAKSRYGSRLLMAF